MSNMEEKNKSSNNMKIEFTKKQFEELLKVAYLGNWMANAIHNGTQEDPQYENIDGIEDYIFSFAKEFGFENYVDYEDKYKKYFPTNEFDELVQKFIEDYDEDCFWEELFYRIYDRDFERAYSDEEISKMEMKERFKKEEPFRKKWDNEFNEHGIERLEIKE